MEYYPAIKKNEILPFAATWMNLQNIILSELSQRQILYDITYMWNLKNNTNKSIYKIDSLRKQTLGTKGEREERGIKKEYAIKRYKLYIKQINNKDLLYYTGNYIQYIIITYNRK